MVCVVDVIRVVRSSCCEVFWYDCYEIESVCCCFLVFFFQAEDGIRDWSVTGVQTCALPIWEEGSEEVDAKKKIESEKKRKKEKR